MSHSGADLTSVCLEIELRPGTVEEYVVEDVVVEPCALRRVVDGRQPDVRVREAKRSRGTQAGRWVWTAMDSADEDVQDVPYR